MKTSTLIYSDLEYLNTGANTAMLNFITESIHNGTRKFLTHKDDIEHIVCVGDCGKLELHKHSDVFDATFVYENIEHDSSIVRTQNIKEIYFKVKYLNKIDKICGVIPRLFLHINKLAGWDCKGFLNKALCQIVGARIVEHYKE